MFQLTQIILTSSLTVLGGVLIYIIGQIILYFLLSQFMNKRKL